MAEWMEFCSKHWELAVTSSGAMVSAAGFRQTLLNSRKTRREIQRLERESEEAISLIARPTVAEIERYAAPFRNARSVVVTGILVTAVGIALQIEHPSSAGSANPSVAVATVATPPVATPPPKTEQFVVPEQFPIHTIEPDHLVLQESIPLLPAGSSRPMPAGTAAPTVPPRSPASPRKIKSLRLRLQKMAIVLPADKLEVVVNRLGLPVRHSDHDRRIALQEEIRRADKARLREIAATFSSVR